MMEFIGWCAFLGFIAICVFVTWMTISERRQQRRYEECLGFYQDKMFHIANDMEYWTGDPRVKRFVQLLISHQYHEAREIWNENRNRTLSDQ